MPVNNQPGGGGMYLPPLNPSPTRALQTRPVTRPAVPVRRPVTRSRSAKVSDSSVLPTFQTPDIDDEFSAFDPTNPFRRRSSDPSQDTITISERLSAYIDMRRLTNQLRIWAKNAKARFEWAAHSVKSYTSKLKNLLIPQIVQISPSGFYRAGYLE